MEVVTQSHRPRSNRDYVGDSDGEIFAFISNLADQLQTASPLGPEAFGLTADDLAIITAARDAYTPLYYDSKSPRRTTVVVTAKNGARDEADRIGRMYAQIIKNQPPDRVSDTLKVMAGVPVEKTTRTPFTGGPASFPRLSVDTRGSQLLVPEVTIRFRDDDGSGSYRNRMPREQGVTHMILHAQIVPGPPHPQHVQYSENASAFRVIDYVTRNPHTVRLDRALLDQFGVWEAGADHPGDLTHVGVMFRGQWLNAKGETGPLGPAVAFDVGMRGVESGVVRVLSRERLPLAA